MTRPGERLRIGYLTTDLSSGAGWGRYSRSLAESVAEHADVAALTSGVRLDETKLKNVRVVLPAAEFSIVAQVRTFWAVMKYFRDRDVIHSLVEPYAPAAALAGSLLRIPVTMTLHGTYSVPPKSWSFKRMLMRFMYRRMKIVTTGSTYTEEKTREQAKLGECRFIPNGVNLERFRVLEGLRRAPMMMTVGALKKRKGVDSALRAFAIVKRSVPDARYVVVGDNAHDVFGEQVRSLIQELGIEQSVDFKENISDEELVRLYNECRAFVLLARSSGDSFEGFPMVYYEANGCGTPVVTTGGFGSEYAIKDSENGFLVPQEDPEAAAQKITQLFTDDALFSRMSRSARQEAEAHSWDKIAQKLMDMYRAIVAL